MTKLSRRENDQSREIANLKIRIQTLEKLVMTDPLTGIGNRRKMVELLKEHVTSLTRNPQPVSVVVFDMDNLKSINDGKDGGHHAGDKALKELAEVIVKCARVVDAVCRTGGDEFAVVLNADERGVEKLIERVRKSLLPTSISVSVGSATLNADHEIKPSEIQADVESLLKMADSNMYIEKRAKKLKRS